MAQAAPEAPGTPARGDRAPSARAVRPRGLRRMRQRAVVRAAAQPGRVTIAAAGRAPLQQPASGSARAGSVPSTRPVERSRLRERARSEERACRYEPPRALSDALVQRLTG